MRKSETVTFRLTAEDKDYLLRISSLQDVSISEYLQRLIRHDKLRMEDIGNFISENDFQFAN